MTSAIWYEHWTCEQTENSTISNTSTDFELEIASLNDGYNSELDKQFCWQRTHERLQLRYQLDDNK